MSEETLWMMVLGHEIWLEKRGKENGSEELSVMYGHNMRPDGAVNLSRLQPVLFNPDGSKGLPTLKAIQDKVIMQFAAAADGYYTAYVDMGVAIWSRNNEGYKEGPKFKFKDVTYAGAFHQMAKFIVPVGNAGEFSGKPFHGILEIVPGGASCQVGSDAAFTVMYEDKPLVGVDVKAVSKKEGKEMAIVKTDRSGVARIPITAEGEWMFLARHVDSSKKVSEEFDESVFINTLVMEAR
ncbi:MAG TPA: DUF4198 domain-containing protein [Methanothrix sp.]|nr:DUF4198 domain-containing protein [Methanothrix sp.]HPT38139.1 DUF4198 domain-containing protein [Methanothrix sp.]